MTAKDITALSKEEFQQFLASIDVVLSDCDGVLWSEAEVIPGSPEVVDKFKQLGKKFFYITNNNTKTRTEFVDKCNGLNYKATMDEIVCTSFLAAVYLAQRQFNKKVYVVGSIGIGKELEAMGIKHCGIGPDILDGNELDVVNNFTPDPEVGAVIIGFDKHFSYPKLAKAVTYSANPNIHFIGTNADTDRPSPNSNKFPGTGCFIRAIEAGCNRKATIVGKPEPFLIDHIIKKYNLNPERTLMIGDNCKTDILLGKRSGFKTLLVLSGVTTKTDIDALHASKIQSDDVVIPDYYANQLGDILQMF